MAEPRFLSVKEFRAAGYLQEINRQLLHPLGLALEAIVDDSGEELIQRVWDYRHDPDGIVYVEEMLRDPEFTQRALRIRAEFEAKAHVRGKNLGFVVQPLPGESYTYIEVAGVKLILQGLPEEKMVVVKELLTTAINQLTGTGNSEG